MPDVSLNAIANLGYAEGRFLKAVYPGDTLTATSEVIGLKENSNRQSGVVYVRTKGAEPARRDGRRLRALGDGAQARPRRARARSGGAEDGAPRRAGDRSAPPARSSNPTTSRSPARRIASATMRVGEKIDHVDGVTVEESDHMLATRLYQNTAKVHFNQFSEGQGRFGRRLIYGGHVISLARALSFNGLANAFHVAAINGGRHVAPLFAGDTVFAWSEILETAELPGRADVGALRVRMVATKNRPCADFPDRAGEAYDPSVVLDFDIWVLIPR